MTSVTAWANKYQDPETRVNYIYTPGSGVAEVYNDGNENQKIKGYITLLTKFTVDGQEYKVTSIRNYAFMSCIGLQGIAITTNIETIGQYAFTLCENLSSVYIGRSVKEIDSFAFTQNDRITSIQVDANNPYFDSRNDCNAIIEKAQKKLVLGCMNTVIPDDVTMIGSGAFYYSPGPKNLHISKNVTQIFETSFCVSGGLETISVDEANPVYDSRNNCNAIIETATNKLIRGSSKTVTPQDVKEIGSRAFMKCAQLEQIDIPEGVVNIGASAFMDCSSLKNILIPASAETISDFNIVRGCSSLQTIKVAEGNKNFVTGEEWNAIIRKSDGKLIAGCMNTRIPSCNYAFENCTHLTSIEIPASVEKIGNSAFYGCNDLEKVISHIKEPKSIDSNCFMVKDGEYTSYHWTEATLYVPKGCLEKYRATDGWKKFKTIEEFEETETPSYKDGDMFTAEVGNGIELRFTVISQAEKTCMLGITETLEGEYHPTAFADGSGSKVTGMASMSVAIEIPEYVNAYKVIEIAPQALQGSHLTGVKIPTTVRKIGDRAFYATWIATLEIPASVTEIGEMFFASPKLQRVIVENGNPVYDSRDNCNAIIETATNTLVFGFKGTTIVEGIECIGEYAFTWYTGNDDSSLEIHIPKTVTQIVDNPFFYNQATERITVAEDNPVYDSRNNCNAIIHTATGELVAGCKNTVIPDGVTRIGRQAFSCLAKTMESLTLPETILSIGNQAFYKTSVNVVLPPYLQVIEDYAFRQNSAIEELVIPATVTSIGKDAFFMCSNLKKVTSMIMEPMPLGDHAFDVPGYTWTDATLYVPYGTKAAYEQTEGWKEFKNIVEMEDQAGIHTADVYGNGRPFDVYTVTGRKVRSQTSSLKDLKKGVYIVQGKKVVVSSSVK